MSHGLTGTKQGQSGTIRVERKRKAPDYSVKLEAPPGFEPGIEVLQTSALPLGDGAGRNCVQGDSGRVYAQQQHPSTSLGVL